MVHFLVVLVLAIALLVAMVIKFKVHPALALFACGMVGGIAFGYGVSKTSAVFTGGFGTTLGGIGCTIIFGSIIASGIQDTGSVKSMVNFFIKLFRGKCLELSTALAAFVMSIPVFGDITQVLVAPIAAFIAKRKNLSMSQMSTWIGVGASLTHSIVPPTPGILAVTIMLGADLGMTIFYGTLISFISLLVVWLLFRSWVGSEWIEPRPDYVEGVVASNSPDYRDLLIKEEGLPGVVSAAFPILLPVVLIAVNSFTGIYLPEGNAVRDFFAMVGDRNVALFLGVICAFINGYIYRASVRKLHKEGADMREILFGNWVTRALHVALLPLMITAMGGGFSSVIKTYPGVDALGGVIVAYNIPAMLVPFVISAIMMLAVGSRTTAGMTSAAIVLPMMGQLHLSPLACTLLTGAGTMIGSHVSDSGFWVNTQLYNLTTKQGLKYITFIGSVTGIVCLLCIWVLLMLGAM